MHPILLDDGFYLIQLPEDELEELLPERYRSIGRPGALQTQLDRVSPVYQIGRLLDNRIYGFIWCGPTFTPYFRWRMVIPGRPGMTTSSGFEDPELSKITRWINDVLRQIS